GRTITAPGAHPEHPVDPAPMIFGGPFDREVAAAFLSQCRVGADQVGPVDDLVPAHQGPGHAGVPSICRRYEEWVHLWIPFFRWPPAGGSRVPSAASRPEWEHCLPGNAQRVLMRVEADFREVV